MFLLDTNVVSELRQGERGNLGVSDWYASVQGADLFTSALVTRNINHVQGLGANVLNPFAS